MVELTRQGRYDRMTDTAHKLIGKAPINMRDFVKLHAAEFTPREPDEKNLAGKGKPDQSDQERRTRFPDLQI